MAVILELSVPPDDLAIGRVLPLSVDESVQLESMVPIGGEVVPFVRARGIDPDTLEAVVREDPRVETVEQFSIDPERALFAFDWRLDDDVLFAAIEEAGGYVLEATGAADQWRFRLRFGGHSAVAAFENELAEASVSFQITAVFQETAESARPRFGLTRPQLEALVAALEAGYFEIPRDVTTAELADEFAISDQAFIERLRRAVSNLSEHTVMTEVVG